MMSPTKRIETVNKAARELSDLPKFRADLVLMALGVPDTFAWWDTMSKSSREKHLTTLLRVQSDVVIEQLAKYLAGQDIGPDGVEISVTLSDTVTAKDEATVVASDGGGEPASIFVVHGRNDSAREQTARMLDNATGSNVSVVVLLEQPNSGATVIEKFEHNTEQVAYAVVLLTGDDEGRALNTVELRPRGRQNVILELGYFVGKIGRGRVAVVFEKGVEIPSDISGLVYIELDATGAWKFKLARELKAVGIGVDLSRIPH